MVQELMRRFSAVATGEGGRKRWANQTLRVCARENASAADGHANSHNDIPKTPQGARIRSAARLRDEQEYGRNRD
jgi:hypothetical protein